MYERQSMLSAQNSLQALRQTRCGGKLAGRFRIALREMPLWVSVLNKGTARGSQLGARKKPYRTAGLMDRENMPASTPPIMIHRRGVRQS